MTKARQIISELYQSKEICAAIDKMEPAELRDDLRQELFLILLEKEEEKIVNLHHCGGLRFYAIRILLWTIKSKRSKFYYQYRKNRHVEFQS